MSKISFTALIGFFACLATFGAHGQTTVAGSALGEFAVSPTGAATYRIPIQVPPGVAGMEPKLELVYNSQSGNGLLGMGWGLSGLSSITRCPRTRAQDGAMGSVNFDLNDRYCMDGQRLILVSGTYGAAGSEYRTEVENFSKITAVGSAGNGPTSFTVKTKSGLIVEYGNTEDSRIEAVKAVGAMATWPIPTVRVWAQNKVTDVKGNYMTVSYAEDGVNGEYYPSRIDYAGNVSTGQLATNSVRLIPTTIPRLDVRTAFQAGSQSTLSKRIGNIQTYAASTLVNDYQLTYLPQSLAVDRSQLSKLTQCDGSQLCLASKLLTWDSTGTGWSPPHTNNGLHGVGAAGMWFVDINADGLLDYVTKNRDGSLHWNLSTGSGWAPSQSQSGLHGVGSAGMWFIDINGDGLVDYVTKNHDGSLHWNLSTGSGWAPSQSQSGLHGVGSAGMWFVDINGDGLVDFVTKNHNGNMYWNLSTGSGWGPSQSQSGLHGVGSAGMWFVDINGDGLVDYVTKNHDGSLHWNLSTGSGWGPSQSQSGLHGVGAAGLWFVDINGDGMVDYVTKNRDGTLHWNLSTGSGWAPSQSQSGLHGVGSAGMWFVDINGDGFIDYVTKNNDLAIHWDTNLQKSMLPLSILDGSKLSIALTHASVNSQNTYTKDSSPNKAVYPRVDIQSPLYVVSTVSKSNGVGGVNVTNYSYGGLKAELGTGRGMLGFRWMKSKEVATGIESYTEYSQDFPYTGMAIKSETRLAGAGNAGVLKRSTSAPKCKIPLSGAACVIQARCDQSANSAACTAAANARYFPYVESNQEESWDLGGAAYPVISTATEYGLDSEGKFYGDPTKVTTSVAGGGSKSSVNEYYPADTGNWVLGRLKKATVTSTTP